MNVNAYVDGEAGGRWKARWTAGVVWEEVLSVRHGELRKSSEMEAPCGPTEATTGPRSPSTVPVLGLRSTIARVHGCRVMRPTLPRQLRLRKTWHINPAPRATAALEQSTLRAAYYRGGTSYAVFLQPQDLPANLEIWQPLFRQVLGSVGQGETYGRSFGRIDPATKRIGNICLVEPYHKTKEDGPASPHIDYTHVAVNPKHGGHVEVDAASANLLCAVGHYAYNARLLPPDLYKVKNGQITIIIRITNTMKLVECTFSVVQGQAAVTGNHIVDGVKAKGAKISLAFQDPTCSTTRERFPTGKAVDMVEGYKVTCIDGAVPVVFIRADTVGVSGTILPHELNEKKDVLDTLESIRRAAAVQMGLADSKTTAPRTVPKIAIVSQSSRHFTVSYNELLPPKMDLVVRFISDTEPHPAIPLTGALTTAVAARVPGTVVEQLLAPEEVLPGTLTIAHPSGITQVKLDYDTDTELPGWVGTVSSTAQRLFEGKAYWTEPYADPKADSAPKTITARHARGLAFINEIRKRDSPLDLIKRFYETHNDDPDAVSALAKGPQTRAQPAEKPDLPLPAPPHARDSSHLLQDLWALRHTLTHFTSQHPSISNPKLPSPFPESVRDSLSAINAHVKTLVSSTYLMPRPLRHQPLLTSDQAMALEWRKWEKLPPRKKPVVRQTLLKPRRPARHVDPGAKVAPPMVEIAKPTWPSFKESRAQGKSGGE